MKKKIAILIVLCFVIVSLPAQHRGEDLTLRIAVLGPGDELYFWWGHIALIIDDASTGNSYFYDYGLFSFDQENFFLNFAFGRLIYSSDVSPTRLNFAVYRNTNRSIIVYTLDLPPETRLKVKEFAQKKVLPEHRDYYYHHFKDNCSTRIRDIIDLATGGQFSEQFKNTPGRFTLRQHVRRHTWFNPAVDWALNFWMGQVIDSPITVWEEMFLPSEVGKHIQDFWFYDIHGVRRQLVTGVEVVFEAQGRPIVLDYPPVQWPRKLFFSLGISAVFFLFFYFESKKHRLKTHKLARVLAGLSMSFTGFIFGFAGLLLYFMNLFTDHDYTFENFNMLFGTPLLLAAVPLGFCYAFNKKNEKKYISGIWLRLLWLFTVLGIFISILLNIFPFVFQDNLADQMLFLPISLVFALHPFGLKEAALSAKQTAGNLIGKVKGKK